MTSWKVINNIINSYFIIVLHHLPKKSVIHKKYIYKNASFRKGLIVGIHSNKKVTVWNDKCEWQSSYFQHFSFKLSIHGLCNRFPVTTMWREKWPSPYIFVLIHDPFGQLVYIHYIYNMFNKEMLSICKV